MQPGEREFEEAAEEFDREAAIREIVNMLRQMDDTGIRAVRSYARSAVGD